jgi:hypothetical protein
MRECRRPLGKGEVVSSILTGSTTKIPPLFESSEISSNADMPSFDRRSAPAKERKDVEGHSSK